MKLHKYLDGFISLLYPRVCAACGNSLFKHEEVICMYCLNNLPKTDFHRMENSPLDQVFWGRVDLQHTTAFYEFHKKGKVQVLLHKLKYSNRPDVGIYLGRLMGRELKNSGRFFSIDAIVPVPLHERKQRKRGYNQSEQIAIGLGQGLGVEVDAHSFVRTVNTATQTRKSRIARWENVKEVFEVAMPDRLQGKHLLLIDDVITTGATLEAAARCLLAVEGVTLSIACLAFAHD